MVLGGSGMLTQATVNVGSQILGVVRFRMMLHGICKVVSVGQTRSHTRLLTSNRTYPTK